MLTVPSPRSVGPVRLNGVLRAFPLPTLQFQGHCAALEFSPFPNCSKLDTSQLWLDAGFVLTTFMNNGFSLSSPGFHPGSRIDHLVSLQLWQHVANLPEGGNPAGFALLSTANRLSQQISKAPQAGSKNGVSRVYFWEVAATPRAPADGIRGSARDLRGLPSASLAFIAGPAILRLGATRCAARQL